MVERMDRRSASPDLPPRTSAAKVERARDVSLTEQALLNMQHAVGNRAVAAALGEMRIQRFTEFGHKLIGDTAAGKDVLKLGDDVEMSYGDAVAMGDYFRSFDAMRRLAAKTGIGRGTQGVVRYVLWHKIWGKPKKDKLGKWYDEGAIFEAEQTSRSLDSTNISHFPNPSSGDTGRDMPQKNQRKFGGEAFGAASTYREAHEEAMHLAHDNGTAYRQSSLGNNDDAQIADGFACHFLTDSFSASHLRTPRASIKEYWDAKVPDFHHKLIEWLASKVDHHSWGAKRVGAPLLGGSIKTLARDQLSIALSAGAYSFGNLVSLIVHDAEGAAGVEATIDGKSITLVGDKDLVNPTTGVLKETDNAKQTLDAAVTATKASLEDIYDAFMAGSKGEDLQTAMKKARGPNNLYRAERLVPTAVPDKDLPGEKQTLPWMHNTIDQLFANPRMHEALKKWGPEMADSFDDRLKDMEGIQQEAKDAIRDALVVPLKSGDADKIASVIRAIASR